MGQISSKLPTLYLEEINSQVSPRHSSYDLPTAMCKMLKKW